MTALIEFTLYYSLMFPILAPMKVDKHIRRLDSDLSRFEQELKLKEPGLRRTSISSIAEMAPPTLPSSKSRDFLTIGNFQKYRTLCHCSYYMEVYHF